MEIEWNSGKAADRIRLISARKATRKEAEDYA
jgi:uncharacterized DUF497 family protein